MASDSKPAEPLPINYPAFPRGTHISGMGIREYFAAKAMQGLLSGNGVYGNRYNVAQAAVELADALIEILAKGD